MPAAGALDAQKRLTVAPLPSRTSLSPQSVRDGGAAARRQALPPGSRPKQALLEHVDRMVQAVNSVYTPEELAPFNTVGAQAGASSSSSHAVPPDIGDPGLAALEASLAAVGDQHRRPSSAVMEAVLYDAPTVEPSIKADTASSAAAPEGLAQLLQDGRVRIMQLLNRLHTTERAETLSALAHWFRTQEPKALRESEILRELEQRLGETSKLLQEDADEKTQGLEEDALKSFQQLQGFYTQMQKRASVGGSLEAVEAQHRKALESFQSAVSNQKDVDELHAAQELVRELQARVKEVQDGLADVATGGTEEQREQRRVDRLAQVMLLRQEQLGDLAVAVQEKAVQSEVLWDYLKHVGQSPEDLPEPKDMSVAVLVDQIRERLRTSKLPELLHAFPAIVQLQAVEEAERRSVKALEVQLEVLRGQLETKEMILAVVRTGPTLADALAVGTLDPAAVGPVSPQPADAPNTGAVEVAVAGDAPETNTDSPHKPEPERDAVVADDEKLKSQLLQTLEVVKKWQGKLEVVEAEAEVERAAVVALEAVEAEVKRNIHEAILNLADEQVEGVDRGEVDVFWPSDWRRHLEQAWRQAAPKAEYHAQFLWPTSLAAGLGHSRSSEGQSASRKEASDESRELESAQVSEDGRAKSGTDHTSDDLRLTVASNLQSLSQSTELILDPSFDAANQDLWERLCATEELLRCSSSVHGAGPAADFSDLSDLWGESEEQAGVAELVALEEQNALLAANLGQLEADLKALQAPSARLGRVRKAAEEMASVAQAFRGPSKQRTVQAAEA